MTKLATLALALALSGCATAQLPAQPMPSPAQDVKAETSLAQVTIADIDAAIVIAQAGGDTDNVACLQQIKLWLGNPKPAPSIVGPISAFAATRVGVSRIRSGVPPEMHRACAVIIVDANQVLLRLGILAATPIR